MGDGHRMLDLRGTSTAIAAVPRRFKDSQGDTPLRLWQAPCHRHSVQQQDRQITRTAPLHEGRGCTMLSGFRGFRRVSRGGSAQRLYTRRPALEGLESRLVPAVTFTQTSLVTDDQAVLAGLGLPAAARTDPNLVQPWGMALGQQRGLWDG